MLHRPLLVVVLGAAAAIAQQQDPEGVRWSASSGADVAQEQVAFVSLPFAPGELRAAAGSGACAFVVGRDGADDGADAATWPARPLLHWPDGSIAVAQLQAKVRLQPRETAAFRAVALRDQDGAAQPWRSAGHRPLLPSPLPIWTELVDPWGRVLRADLAPDASAGPGGVVADTGLVRITRFRSPHRLDMGDGRTAPLLDLRAYLVTVDQDRGAELTVLLDNQEPGAGPLGAVRFSAFRLCVGDQRLRFLPAFAREQGLASPWVRDEQTVVQDLVAPGSHYLGDGTAKAFRLRLHWESEEDGELEREAAAWSGVRFSAFADLDDVRASRSFGAFGGPAPVLPADVGDESRQLGIWRQNSRFGLWGGFGDPEDGRLGGAPRHGDSLLHNALRWRSAPLLTVAEGMVLQHPLRPTGGRAPGRPADMAPYRQSLRAQSESAPHGYPRIDYEHVSAHLLFDYFWLTGDELARDELRRLGRALPQMLAAVPFRTSRGEGRCLEAGALCARAAGDRELLARLCEHAAGALASAMAPQGSQGALFQPAHPLVLEGKCAFDAPAQMAALVRGLAALQAASGDERLRPLLVRTADAMAGPAWSGSTGPKTLVGAPPGGRYSFAASPEDLFGANRTLIGAFLLAAEQATDETRAQLYEQRADFLIRRELPPTATLSARLLAAASPWLQIAFDRRKVP